MKRLISTAAVLSLLLGAGAHAASSSKTTKPSRANTQLGDLSCEVDGGIGLVLGSSKKINCDFTHKNGSIEKYTGTLGKLGLDVGITKKSYLKWVVVTPAGNTTGAGALAGNYVGVSASGSFGLGLGANALVGGSIKTIGLQPLSVEGTQGLNVAVGATKLTLKAVR